MKFKTLSVLAGSAAVLATGSAQAAPVIGAVVDMTSPFLVANGLMSARITVTGFDAGSFYQGFIGTPGNPWTVSTANGTGFWNLTGVFTDGSANVLFDGATTFYAATAATTNNAANAAFDTGLLGNPATLGNPSDDDPTESVGGFALKAGAVGLNGLNGENDIAIDPVAWLSLSPTGVAAPATLNVMRLTWSNLTDATVSFVLAMNTPAGDVPMSITIPGIPAPGALALLGVAGLVGTRRRRA